MSRIIYITGGARSGKSTYAEELAENIGEKILYIATAIGFDAGMKDRIKKHQERRPSHWDTLEAYKNFKLEIEKKIEKYDTILFDCITVMVTNIMLEDHSMDWNKVSHGEIDEIEKSVQKEIFELIDTVNEKNLKIIIVSNELGMGIVPENRLARIFRDIAGRVNQIVAEASDEAYLVVSGQKLRLKWGKWFEDVYTNDSILNKDSHTSRIRCG